VSLSESDVEANNDSNGAEEAKALVAPSVSPAKPTSSTSAITATGLKVLILLAVQNCSKNLLLRYVMKEKPQFLTSAAVIGVEMTKLTLSSLYIWLVDRRSLYSIYVFMKEDYRNLLLLSVPAAAYNLQSSLEYVALANLDAAMFSVLVQTKLCMTAICAFLVLHKKLKRIQIMSLILLTAGVMLCNLTKATSAGSEMDANTIKGICATLGIATSSGFASVYTEKVIKAQRNVNVTRQNYSLAYMQVQLATASLVIMGLYAMVKDYEAIMTQVCRVMLVRLMLSPLSAAADTLRIGPVAQFYVEGVRHGLQQCYWWSYCSGSLEILRLCPEGICHCLFRSHDRSAQYALVWNRTEYYLLFGYR